MPQRMLRGEQHLGRDCSEELDQHRNDGCPPGLVARAETGTVVAVEVLVEKDVVAPVRVLLKLLVPP